MLTHPRVYNVLWWSTCISQFYLKEKKNFTTDCFHVSQSPFRKAGVCWSLYLWQAFVVLVCSAHCQCWWHQREHWCGFVALADGCPCRRGCHLCLWQPVKIYLDPVWVFCPDRRCCPHRSHWQLKRLHCCRALTGSLRGCCRWVHRSSSALRHWEQCWCQSWSWSVATIEVCPCCHLFLLHPLQIFLDFLHTCFCSDRPLSRNWYLRLVHHQRTDHWSNRLVPAVDGCPGLLWNLYFPYSPYSLYCPYGPGCHGTSKPVYLNKLISMSQRGLQGDLAGHLTAVDH